MGLDTTIECKKIKKREEYFSYYPSRKFTNLLVDLAVERDNSVLQSVCQYLNIDLKPIKRMNTYLIYDEAISGKEIDMGLVNSSWIDVKTLLGFMEEFNRKMIDNTSLFTSNILELDEYYLQFFKDYNLQDANNNLGFEVRQIISHFKGFNSQEQIRIWYF